jgi:hypothetical protein
MLQAHSFLWHYLWVAPNVLLFVEGILVWRRGSVRRYPWFVAFALLGTIGQLCVYAADIAPSVSGPTFWRVDWGSLLVETFLKFAIIGGIFSQVFEPYPSVSRLSRLLVRGFGGALVLVAALAAAFAHSDSSFRLISGAHLLEQTGFMIESGLIVFLFLFAAYFHLSLDRASFGILLGLGISACVHLATWAVAANAGLPPAKRVFLDFANMGTYHLCVLIWFYYLLVPQRVPAKPAVPPKDPSAGQPPGQKPEDELEEWNRELERLIHQ